jgi:hypothetical protein
MSNGRNDLIVFLGAAFASLVGLVVLHEWYASYIDLRYHQHLAEAGPSEPMLAARQDDQAALQRAKVPLDQAISRLAQRGRDNVASITPAASQDLSAISGWIHHPAFKPVVAHPIRTPRATGAAQPAAPASEAAALPSTPAPSAGEPGH